MNNYLIIYYTRIRGLKVIDFSLITVTVTCRPYSVVYYIHKPVLLATNVSCWPFLFRVFKSMHSTMHISALSLSNMIRNLH